jgi:hypothetical protein
MYFKKKIVQEGPFFKFLDTKPWLEKKLPNIKKNTFY